MSRISETDENTEKLSRRARELINAEFRNMLASRTSNSSNRNCNYLFPSPVSKSSSKSSSNIIDIKTARKKLQEEWAALKNATILSNDSNDNSNEKESEILLGVVAYIEINNVPKAIALRVILEKLGASVKARFTREVTHVIFKNGTLNTFKRAKLLNVHLVSVMWIDACRNAKERVAETLFPVNEYRNYIASPKRFQEILKIAQDKQNQNEILKELQENAISNKNQNASKESVRNDSSESALILQISSDESGNKSKEKLQKNALENNKQNNLNENECTVLSIHNLNRIQVNSQNAENSPSLLTIKSGQRRLFSSANDENIDNSGKDKKTQNSNFKRQLFTQSLDVTLNKSSDLTQIDENRNPYMNAEQRRRKKNRTGRKKNEAEKRTSSFERRELVREFLKLTKIQEIEKKKEETAKKRELRKEETARKKAEVERRKEELALRKEEAQRNKLTQEERKNIKRANKMARRRERQILNATLPRTCRKLNIYSGGIKKPSLVTTYLHKTDNKFTQSTISSLGFFTFQAKVGPTTTHVVCGGPTRTVNLLKGIARGCWIVDLRWVRDSLDAGFWLQEYDYELDKFSPAVQKCRIERQALGDDYHLNIFRNIGTIYLSTKCKPSRKDLKDLILLCEGRICTNIANSDIIVGDKVDHPKCLSENWILDSIAFARCKSIKKYLLVP